MTRYVLIALLFVSLLGYGFWERGQAIAADAQAATLSAQLTQAQSDLLIAKSSAKVGGEVTIKLGTTLAFNFDQQISFTDRQTQLEKTDVKVAAFVDTPVPLALGCLLDDEDQAYLSNRTASRQPPCTVPSPAPPLKPEG